MWMDPEEARSDFILTAAAAVFVPLLVAFLARLPFYPSGGVTGSLLGSFWVLAATGLVPLLLARYRDQGGEAFGLTDTGRASLASGLLLALPLVITGIINLWASGTPLTRAWLGLFSIRFDILELALVIVAIVVSFTGLLLFFTFLTTRARDAFAQNEISQTEALRTFGMGAVAASLVLGLLFAATAFWTVAAAVLTSTSLAALVLLADRLVEPGRMTTRATVLAPAIAAGVLALLRLGGFFGGNLLNGLYIATLAATIAVVTAVLVETRTKAWAVVPMFLALAIYPSLPDAVTGFISH